MRIIVLIVGLSMGLYFIIADRLKIPYLKTSKAIMNLGRDDRKLTSVIEAVIMDISVKLSKFMPMDTYKENRLRATLEAAGINMTPKCFQAHAFVKAFMVGTLVIPCLLVFPLISAFILTLQFLYILKNTRRQISYCKIKRMKLKVS